MTDQDIQHLRLLSIFHYLVGGLGFLFSCLPLLYVGIGIAMLRSPASFISKTPNPPPPAFVGWILIGLGAAFFVLGMALSFGIVLSGRFIAKRKYSLYKAYISC